MINHFFQGIEVTNGSATINNNTIGSLSGLGSIKDWGYNTGSTSIYGILLSSSGSATITNNSIGGIEALIPDGNNIPVTMIGIGAGLFSGANNTHDSITCTGNTVGGTDTNSLRNDSQNLESSIEGISVRNKSGTIGSNTVRNMIGYGGTDGVVGIERQFGISIYGDLITSGNTIANLTNGNETGATDVHGIKQATYVDNNNPIISGNLIYGLSSASSNPAAEINGIYGEQASSDMYNNMIAMTGVANAAEVNGIKVNYTFTGGVAYGRYIYHNSIYLSGTKTSGNSPSRACYLTGTAGSVHFYVFDNIFENERTNAGSSTAKHYSMEMKPGYYLAATSKANLYYGMGNGYVLGKADVDKPTLAEWLKPYPYSDTGYVGNPHYLSTVGSPANLHIDTSVPTMVESNGEATLPAMATDFDNETRSGLTPVDIGADAGNFTPFVLPVITTVGAVTLCTNSTIDIIGTGLDTVTEAKIGSTVMAISYTSATSLSINTGTSPLSGSLTLTNPSGAVTYPTTINIYAAPAFTQQPVSATACGASAVSFSVTATNAITYQWRRNGVDLANGGIYSNVNTPTLNISSAGSVPFGSNFDVVITGTACDVTSSGATLFANLQPMPVISASGPTAICPGGSVTLSTNYNGPALQFDGVNDFFEFPRHISNDFTIEYWVKTTQTGSTGSQWYNGRGIVDANISGITSPQRDFGTSLLGNKLAFGIGGYMGFGTYTPVTIQSTTPINSGQWIHVAVTRREATGELKIYINGVLDAAGFTPIHGSVTTPNIRVGGLQGTNSFFNGSIDDVRVWQYVRTPAQITSGMSHSYTAGTAALVDNFPINENSGFTTANLATGSSSVLNGPFWTTRATTSNYQAYTWSNGAHTPTINVTTPGNYSVQVTDFNGCAGYSIPVSVTQPSISATTAATICQGSSATLTANGGVSYTWSPSTGLNTIFGPSVIASPTTTTTYTVTGTLASGCQSAKQVIVTVIPPITVSASQLNVMPGGSATLTASGGSGYTWSPAIGLNTTSGASVIAMPAATTTYTVSSPTCNSFATITITVLPEFSTGNNALDFDGTDDYVSIPVQTGSVSGSFTVEAWVKPTHATKNMHVISSRNGQDHSFDIHIKDGNLIHGDIGDGTNWLTTSADATFNYSVNTWTHIAYVVTPTDYKIYANGNLVGSGVLTGTPLLYSPTRFFTIGKNATENTFFQGTMDDIRIYDAALSETQIQSDVLGIYETSGLKAYFNCNEGIAGGNNAGITKLVDQNIPGNFHGTLLNFALLGNTSNWVEGQGVQQQQQPQSIDFQPLADVVYGDADFNLTGSATSGLPVSYSSSNPDVASVTGNTVIIHGVGTTEITATQVGNSFYTAADPVSQMLMVIPKPVTMTDVIVADKIYDRNTSATIAGSISGLIGSDDVGVSVIASFASFDVGNDIPVTMEMTLFGAQSANYIIEQPVVTGNIFPKPVTMPSAVADNKIYDGTTAATITGLLSGVISPDVVTVVSNTGIFASPEVGNNIPVDAQIILGGASVGNYVLEQPSGLSANITAATLTATISGTATICVGQSTALQVSITGSTGTYTVVYTDGNLIYTINDYTSDSNIIVSSAATSHYTLVSVYNANASAGVSGIGTVTITVIPNIIYYADNDGDGFGDITMSISTCTGLPIGYATNSTDCDDTHASVHPGATEIGYNLIDDDCDGSIDEGFPPKITGTLLCNYTLDTIDT